MAFLVLFAFLAGAGTALSPCVLPVLPALLSAGATGGRRRPLGIVLGLARDLHGDDRRAGDAWSTASAWATRSLRDARRSSRSPAFGVAIAVPARRPTAWRRRSARLARFGPASGGRRLLVGPRSSAPRSASSTRPARGRSSPRSIAVGAASGGRSPSALAYALGLGASSCSRSRSAAARVVDRLRRAGRGPACSARSAAVMVADRASRWRPSSTCASRRRSPTTCPPRSSTRRASSARTPSREPAGRPARRRRASRRAAEAPGRPEAGAAATCGAGARLHGQRSAGSTRRRPAAHARGLRGRVVLVDFWTYTCINCLRTLPHLEAWDARYRNDGLTIVGVHSPEFALRARRRQRRSARSARTASATRSRRTTSWRPGTPGATSTGRPST